MGSKPVRNRDLVWKSWDLRLGAGLPIRVPAVLVGHAVTMAAMADPAARAQAERPLQLAAARGGQHRHARLPVASGSPSAR